MSEWEHNYDKCETRRETTFVERKESDDHCVNIWNTRPVGKAQSMFRVNTPDVIEGSNWATNVGKVKDTMR